ncbi:hypothetical protein BDC45DRAFT_451287, partial [Circinella umbellata]
IEVYFEKSEEIETALITGLNFKNGVLIKPCRTLSSNANITKIRLSKLPFMPPTKLLEGIATTLNIYGHAFDCGIYRDAASGIFIGTGFAVLDRQVIEGAL